VSEAPGKEYISRQKRKIEDSAGKMSMFSGLTSQLNQVSGMVASKLGKGQPGEGGEEGAPPPEAQPPQQPLVDENGEEIPVGEEGQAAGGVSGLAQGLMAKAMSAKEGIKEKASNFQGMGNLQGMGANLMQVTYHDKFIEYYT